MYYPYLLPQSDKIKHNPEIGNPVNALKWYNKGYTTSGKEPITLNEYCVPCWSFASQLALLPLPTLEETPITDTETKWQCTIYCDKAKYWSELHNEPIDALIEAILITKEICYENI